MSKLEADSGHSTCCCEEKRALNYYVFRRAPHFIGRRIQHIKMETIVFINLYAGLKFPMLKARLYNTGLERPQNLNPT